MSKQIKQTILQLLQLHKGSQKIFDCIWQLLFLDILKSRIKYIRIFLVILGNFYNDYKFQNKYIIPEVHNNKF